jgi:hypothetical protein
LKTFLPALFFLGLLASCASNHPKTTGSDGAAPTLPVPAEGVYRLEFSHPIWRVVPGDFDGDGILDFVMKSNFTGLAKTMRVEARLNRGAKLWEFDTGVTPALTADGGNADDVPILAWDFNGDGRWEVYLQYYDPANGRWRHRIVDGISGSVLVDAEFPWNWTRRKSMAAIAYRGGIPRVVGNLDLYSVGRLWMFETWTGGGWSLDTMWRYDRSRGMAHDMLSAADVDLNGSDDEILAGRVVLNSDGSVRYDLGRGNADSGHIGFFSSKYSGLVYITGDGDSGRITAVRAVDGSRMWELDMRARFPTWHHFHLGWIADSEPTIPGAELLAVGHDSNWVYVRAEDGTILRTGSPGKYNPPLVAMMLWNGDTYYDPAPNREKPWWGLGRADLGGSGTEELWGGQNTTTLTIRFNTANHPLPSRYANRHYRQDVATFASGYTTRFVIPLVIESWRTTP